MNSYRKRVSALSAVALILLVAVALISGNWAVLVVIAALVAIVMLHEAGHMIVARLSGMLVTEFFLGFGPKIWSVRKGDTEYGVKAILAGGYVKIPGMSESEEVDPETESRTYRRSTFPRKLAVVVAGSVVHFVLAISLLWAVFALIGVPSGSKTVIGIVEPVSSGSSPAISAGLRPGDQVVSVDGKKLGSVDSFVSKIQKSAGVPIQLELRRKGRLVDVTVVPSPRSQLDLKGVPMPAQASELSKGTLGVSESSMPAIPAKKSSPGSAFVKSIENLASATGLIFTKTSSAVGSLWSQFLHPSRPATAATNTNRISSIVGVVQLSAQAAKTGWADVLALLAQINLFIGLFNLIPLPPFDGGHAAVAIYERVRSRRGAEYHADGAKLSQVAVVVLFMVIFLIFIPALYLDITKPIQVPFG